jgi:hypothetical protein
VPRVLKVLVLRVLEVLKVHVLKVHVLEVRGARGTFGPIRTRGTSTRSPFGTLGTFLHDTWSRA